MRPFTLALAFAGVLAIAAPARADIYQWVMKHHVVITEAAALADPPGFYLQTGSSGLQRWDDKTKAWDSLCRPGGRCVVTANNGVYRVADIVTRADKRILSDMTLITKLGRYRHRLLEVCKTGATGGGGAPGPGGIDALLKTAQGCKTIYESEGTCQRSSGPGGGAMPAPAQRPPAHRRKPG